MRTLNLLAFVLLIAGIQAYTKPNVYDLRRSALPDLNHANSMFGTITERMNIAELEKCAQENIGMWMDVNHLYDTEVLISKCDHPILLMYPSTSVSHYLTPEDVHELYQAQTYACDGVSGNNTLDLTRHAIPSIGGSVHFTPDRKSSSHSYPRRVHNITENTIPRVDYKLYPMQKNKYPLKIGSLLAATKDQDLDLQLSISSTAPVSFRFTKCGQDLENLPGMDDPMVKEDIIEALEKMQTMKCGKWWNAGIIEVEISVGIHGADGVLQFHLVEKKGWQHSKWIQRGLLGSIFFVVVVAGTIILRSKVKRLPEDDYVIFWNKYEEIGVIM